MASFMGFVSTKDPRVLCYVTLDGTAAKSYAATPVFRKVMEEALPALGTVSYTHLDVYKRQDEDVVEDLVDREGTFVYVKRQVDEEDAELLAKKGIAGIEFEPAIKRCLLYTS